MTSTQDVKLQLYYDAAWNDAPLFAGAGTTIALELDDDGIGHCKVTCEIDNDSSDFDPSNPLSPLYGKAGLNTPARIVHDGDVRRYVEASEFTPDQSDDFVSGVRGRAWVKFTGEGITRRLGRWTDQLESLLTGHITGYANLVGHWPLEDDRDALAPSYTVGLEAVSAGVTWAEADSPAGAKQAVTVPDGASLRGRFIPGDTSDAGWQFAWACKLPAVPPSGTYIDVIRWSSTNGYRWYFAINSTHYRWQARNESTGSVLWETWAVHSAGSSPDEWVAHRVKATRSGTTVTVEPAWYGQNQEVPWGVTDTFTGSLSSLEWWWGDGNAGNDGMSLSHVFGVQTGTDDLQSTDALRAFDGYVGETAGSRFGRITAQLGITRFAIGASADTMPMGIQRPDTFMNLLKEIASTDTMIIYDERYSAVPSLTRRTRRAQYNLTPKLALTYPTHVQPPLRRKLSDEGTANIVTAKNRQGGEYTSTRETGPRNRTLTFPGVGEYRATLDVNTASTAALKDLADFGRARGTVDRPRFETIIVDVVEHPSLLAACQDMNLGDVISLTGYGPDVLYLRTLKTLERIGSQHYSFEFETEPYDPWIAGEYDDGVSRYDSASTTLAEDITTSETAWDITTANLSDVWSTTAEPYDWMVGGERVTVTSMGAVTGSGPWLQTATVTRAVNGVVKAHSTGDPVHVADPGRYSF